MIGLGERRVAWLATLGLVVVLVPPVVYLWWLTKSPLAFADMDFDNNGIVTFTELRYASAYGIRDKQVGQVLCQEYYALQDGLTLKLECHEAHGRKGP